MRSAPYAWGIAIAVTKLPIMPSTSSARRRAVTGGAALVSQA
jgi:hypothetical protein